MDTPGQKRAVRKLEPNAQYLFSWTQSKGKQSKPKACSASFVFSAVTVYEKEEEKRRKAGKGEREIYITGPIGQKYLFLGAPILATLSCLAWVQKGDT